MAVSILVREVTEKVSSNFALRLMIKFVRVYSRFSRFYSRRKELHFHRVGGCVGPYCLQYNKCLNSRQPDLLARYEVQLYSPMYKCRLFVEEEMGESFLNARRVLLLVRPHLQ